jgi:DNA-binding NarL/FixJ family response regulator
LRNDPARDESKQPVRILVVDDHQPFRQIVCSMLGTKSEWQVIAEASDGLQAVHKAEELQPDLILLDVGLPKLNGIEAARRIRRLAPNSKILFLSHDFSANIVQEALSTGARGYIFKAYVGGELLFAMDAVMQGKQFISPG